MKKIEDLLQIGSGKDYKHLEGGNVPVFGTGGYMASVCEYLMDGETVCIGRKGTINKPFYFNGKFWTVDTLFYTHSYINVLPKFVFYIFSQINWLKHNEASGVPSLSKSTIQQINIFTTTNVFEQRKLTDFLSLIDKRIQTQNKIIKQFKSSIKGMIERLLSKKLRFKDKNGNDFPQWETKKLGEILIKNSNKNKNQKYSLVQSVSNKYGFINQDEMFEDRRVASKDTSNYYVIEKGHFAYNPSRIDVGSLAYKSDNEISVISPLYISFYANTNFLKDNYLLKWFSTEEFLIQMNSSFEGSVRNTLSYEALIKMSISIPSIKEQNLISNLLSKLDDKLEIEINLLQQLQDQKKHLLQNLFI